MLMVCWLGKINFSFKELFYFFAKQYFHPVRKSSRSPFPLIKLFMKKYLLAACLCASVIGVKASERDTTIYRSSMPPGEIKVSKVSTPNLFFEPVPEFPGGIRNFYSYLSGHLNYPANALKMGIQGTVLISVVVEKDGTISNAKIERSVSDELDSEALRLIKLSPRWKPGTINGEAVRVERTLPVNFLLASNRISF